MNIAVLIGIMIAIVIGVTLIPGIIGQVAQNVTNQGGEPLDPALQTMMDILPIIFVSVIILGAVAWIGGSAGGARTRETIGGIFERVRLHGAFGSLPNTPFMKEYFSRRVLELSGAELMQRIGVESVLIDRIFDNSVVDIEPIEMQARDKWWIDSNYDWYIVEKHPKFEMYKMVGLHKRQRGLNCVYILGKDSHTETPYMLRCPPEYLKSTIMECVKWNMNIDDAYDLTEI